MSHDPTRGDTPGRRPPEVPEVGDPSTRPSEDAGRPTGDDTSDDPPPLSRRRLALLLAGPGAALMLAELAQAVLSTALPTVVGELGGLDRLLWVNTAYVLAGTVAMPVVGRIGDRLDRRRAFAAAITVFLAGSVLGGLAPSMGWLIAARVLQGLGGGGMYVLVQALVADLVPVRRRAPVLSGVGAVFAVSAVLGPVLGGWLTENADWRWAFWLNLPVGVLALVGVLVLLPRRGGGDLRRFDLPGLATLAVTATAFVLLVSGRGGAGGWPLPVAVGLGGVAALGAVGFVLAERRASDPLVPLALLTDRTVALGILAGVLVAVAMFGTITYLPTYLQLAFGLSPLRAGLQVLALVGGLGSATVLAAQVVRRTGRVRVLPVVGAVTSAVGLVSMATLAPDSGLLQVGVSLFVLGAGIGCAWDVLVVLLQSVVDPDRVGTVTAVNGFFRETGVLTGTALVGGLFSARLGVELSERVPALAGEQWTGLTPERLAAQPPEVVEQVAAAVSAAFTPVFWVLVPVVLVGAVVLLGVRRRVLPGSAGSTEEEVA